MINHSRTRLLGLLCTCLSFCLLPVRAQGIADNSNSVIVEAQTEVICKSMTQSVERETRTVTILNKKGLDAAHFFCSCDMFRSLQKFSGELINASGQSVRKIKKSELLKSEYSSSLSTDDYLYYYECNYPSFPFTVKYVWEVKCNNGLIGYSTFMPQTDFNQGVEKSAYRIELPAGQQCRHRALNTDGKNIQIKESTGPEGQQIIEVSATQLPPIQSEPFGPSFAQLFPRVYFAPSAFSFDKTQGDMSTWQKYGEWQYDLLNGRDQLTEPLKSKLHELTTNCGTDREKVKAVYDYLAKTTRYVSIQLGIGGLQPIAATDVCRTGFGDCKGLSNYTRAMLNELGIPSTYTVISTTNERLLPDFSSANQMNHVILQVPLPQDTLWLECTNPQLPFGYVHQDIAGHDALLIEPTGGRMYRLPTYPDSLNTQQITARISLSPTAEAKIEVMKCPDCSSTRTRRESSIWNPTSRKTASDQTSTFRKPTSCACKSPNARRQARLSRSTIRQAAISTDIKRGTACLSLSMCSAKGSVCRTSQSARIPSTSISVMRTPTVSAFSCPKDMPSKDFHDRWS